MSLRAEPVRRMRRWGVDITVRIVRNCSALDELTVNKNKNIPIEGMKSFHVPPPPRSQTRRLQHHLLNMLRHNISVVSKNSHLEFLSAGYS